MRVYIATKYKNKDSAVNLAEMLIKNGHSITYEWWHPEKGFCKEEAELCLQGVYTCDVFVALVNKDYAYKGTIFELAIAYSDFKQILIVGDKLDSMIFTLLPKISRVETPIKALKFINELR